MTPHHQVPDVLKSVATWTSMSTAPLMALRVAVDDGRVSLPPEVHAALRDATEALTRLDTAIMSAELDRLP